MVYFKVMPKELGSLRLLLPTMGQPVQLCSQNRDQVRIYQILRRKGQGWQIFMVVGIPAAVAVEVAQVVPARIVWMLMEIR